MDAVKQDIGKAEDLEFYQDVSGSLDRIAEYLCQWLKGKLLRVFGKSWWDTSVRKMLKGSPRDRIECEEWKELEDLDLYALLRVFDLNFERLWPSARLSRDGRQIIKEMLNVRGRCVGHRPAKGNRLVDLERDVDTMRRFCGLIGLGGEAPEHLTSLYDQLSKARLEKKGVIGSAKVEVKNGIYKEALTLLRAGTGVPTAEFREGQYETIDALVENSSPMLVVQKTGWGKSFVYFIATAILRHRGKGPALLISPLLALMRNQIAAAEKMGLRAVRIASDNKDDWDELEEEIQAGAVDIILISPERLANQYFVSEVFSQIVEQVCLMIIDEAHCVSDWGHDFRPDYRRIERIIRDTPSTMRMLATTATANNRVVEDLQHVSGDRLEILRGSLARNNLHMQTMVKDSPSERMAWLACHLPELPGSGIIYVLTKRDARRVAEWLRYKGNSVESYTGESKNREELERKLLNNEVKALVATVALGMGFDKPDLGFVIHYQCPQSVIAYYQQVGRAGRAIESAHALLFFGREDRHINNFFIEQAFPSRQQVDEVLKAIQQHDDNYVSIFKIERMVNLKRTKIEHVLKIMALEEPAPVVNEGKKWAATAFPVSEDFWLRAQRLTALRRSELCQMEEYVHLKEGHMRYLVEALDGNPDEVNPLNLQDLSAEVPEKLLQEVQRFLRHSFLDFEFRKKWPVDGLPEYKVKGAIPKDQRAETGRVLCYYGDAGWGEIVKEGKYEKGCFDDRLIDGIVSMLSEWKLDVQPTWLTCIPSTRHPELVPDFAQRLADRLEIEFIPCIKKVKDNKPQKDMENSAKQALNLDGVFEVDENLVKDEPVFLFDDMIDSRWTMTMGSWLLRHAGAGKVVPIALASTANDS
jgi:ATP-dependent DNA helicase RecQ